MKKKWISISLVLLGIIVLIKVLFFIIPDKQVNGMYLIPKDAMYILESNDPVQAWESLSTSEVWKSIKGHPIFSDISTDANYLDTLLIENKLLSKLIGSRKLYISAHPTTKDDYDFLFLVDLKRSAKAPILYTTLEKVLRNEGFKVTRRVYKSSEILEVSDDSRSRLNLCKFENFLICSYTAPLINKALDQQSNPYFGIDLGFDKVYTRVSQKGSINIYTQWQFLDEYLSYYFSDAKKNALGLDEAIEFSAFDFRIENTSWELNGYTSLVDTQQSYLTALINSGSSEHFLPEVLSNRTAWYLSFNFSSMQKFYDELQNQLKTQPEELQIFEQRKAQIEKLLDINVEKHIVDWIGKEIGIAQMEGTGFGSDDNLAIFLRARDLNHAKKRLKQVTDQVKKRTPAKFRKIEYKNYEIQYLSIKGMFKMLFGSAFDKMDKPYFTYIGDYVVFSNSPMTLIGLIEDFENGRNLIYSPYYKSIQNELRRSTMNAYAAPTKARVLLAQKMDLETRKEFNKGRKYIDALGAFALDLRTDKGQLRTRLRLVQADEIDSVSLTVDEIGEMYRNFAIDKSNAEESGERFVLQYIEDGVFKRFFPNSEQLEMEAEMSKGRKDGDYVEYYQSGEKFIIGKYKKDRRAGLWKFYDKDGNLLKKKRYSF